jgi:hypothetical protein
LTARRETAAYWLNQAVETLGTVALAVLILLGCLAVLGFILAVLGGAVFVLMVLVIIAAAAAVGVSPAVAAVLIFRREAVTFHFLDSAGPFNPSRPPRHERKD